MFMFLPLVFSSQKWDQLYGPKILFFSKQVHELMYRFPRSFLLTSFFSLAKAILNSRSLHALKGSFYPPAGPTTTGSPRCHTGPAQDHTAQLGTPRSPRPWAVLPGSVLPWGFAAALRAEPLPAHSPARREAGEGGGAPPTASTSEHPRPPQLPPPSRA